MSEGDDKLLRSYRELARDEPPPALDAAILAASRRAVGSRPWSQRFAGPVSLAAVLVLALGITLNMQREQPDVEVALSSPDYPVPGAPPDPAPAASATVSPPAAPVAPAEPAADAFRPDTLARKSAPVPAKKPAAESFLKKETLAEAAPERKEKLAAVAPEPPRPEPRAFATSPAAQAPAAPVPQAVSPPQSIAPPSAVTTPAAVAPPPAAAPALPARAAAQSREAPGEAEARSGMKPSALAASREKREAAADNVQAKVAAPLPDPAAELERIARLRADGKHAEADKAIEAFSRAHPEYRIPDPVWQRVRPR